MTPRSKRDDVKASLPEAGKSAGCGQTLLVAALIFIAVMFAVMMLLVIGFVIQGHSL
jgi:hypothetical protein